MLETQVNRKIQRMQKNRMIKSTLYNNMPWKARVFIRKVYYFGSKFDCSVCGSRVRDLLSTGHKLAILDELDVIGAKYREQDTCPVCLSHCRTRLVHKFLRTGTNIESSKLRLLHVAPEFGLYLSLRKISNVEYVPADFVVERYADYIPVEQMDITQISYGADHFDAIVCNHVLEHIENDRLAMAELFRVLKPGGWAILQVPIAKNLEHTFEDRKIVDPAAREQNYGQKDHVRVYAMDYVERLSSVGFVVEVLDALALWGRETTEKLKLNPEEKIFVARKNIIDGAHR